MVMTALALAALCLAEGKVHAFVSDADFLLGEGVEVRAQQPDGVQVLVAPQRGGVMWYMPVAALPETKGVAIYYQRVEKTQPVYDDQRVLCLGYLQRGAWSIPSLHDATLPWGGANNVVMRRSPHRPTWGGFNQHQIVRQDGRYRMLYWDQPAEHGDAGAMLAMSDDGVTWQKDSRGTVFTEHNDAFTLLPLQDGYLLYQTMLEDWPEKPYPDNLDKFRRVISWRESKDLVTWSPQQTLLRPDDQDPPETEFYLMKAFPYEGRYLGILMKYFGDPANPGKHSAIIRNELLFSEDARHWERPFRDTDLGFFSFADPFPDDQFLRFASWKDNALVVFNYRPHGVTAVVAPEDGRFVTPPLTLARPVVWMDASHGWIEVTPQTPDGAPLDAAPTRRVETTPDMSLRLEDSLGADGTPYRLAFRMHRARVFAVASND